jgi:hypothetical protein
MEDVSGLSALAEEREAKSEGEWMETEGDERLDSG